MAYLLINEQPLYLLPSLAQRVGIHEALFLQKIHDWLGDKDENIFLKGRYWIDTVEQRCCQSFPMLKEYTIKQVLDDLLDKGYLIFLKSKGFHKKYFAIDYGCLTQSPSPSKSSCPILKSSSKSYFLQEHEFPLVASSNRNNEEVKELTIGIENICRHMVDIWNQLTHPQLFQDRREALPPEAKTVLINFLANYLISEGLTWQEYCQAIHKIPVQKLPQKAIWKYITLEWATNPTNIRTVIDLVMAAKPDQPYPFKDKPYKDFLKDIKASKGNNRFQNQWLAIAQNLVRNIGQAPYQALFSQVSISEFQGKKLVLEAPDSLIKDYVLTCMWNPLAKAVNAAYPLVDELEIEVKGGREERG